METPDSNAIKPAVARKVFSDEAYESLFVMEDDLPPRMIPASMLDQ